MKYFAMRRFRERFGAGGVLMIFAVIFIAFGIGNIAAPDAPAVSSYTDGTGTVKEVIVSPGGVQFGAKVEYTDMNGSVRTRTMEFDTPVSVGDSIPMNYSTHNPDVAGYGYAPEPVSDGRSNNTAGILEIVGGIGLGIVGAVLLKKRFTQ